MIKDELILDLITNLGLVAKSIKEKKKPALPLGKMLSIVKEISNTHGLGIVKTEFNDHSADYSVLMVGTVSSLINCIRFSCEVEVNTYCNLLVSNIRNTAIYYGCESDVISSS